MAEWQAGAAFGALVDDEPPARAPTVPRSVAPAPAAAPEAARPTRPSSLPSSLRVDDVAGVATALSEGAVQELASCIAAMADVEVVSQQRGEPDLTVAERRDVLVTKLRRQPADFLGRWGSHVPDHLLACFFPLQAANYAIRIYLQDILRQRSSHATPLVRNRRLRYMTTRLEGTSYFGDEEMEQRAPWLFEQYITQHLSAAERAQRAKDAECAPLFSVLLDQMASKRNRERKELQQQAADDAFEEEEDDWDMDEEGGQEKSNDTAAAAAAGHGMDGVVDGGIKGATSVDEATAAVVGMDIGDDGSGAADEDPREEAFLEQRALYRDEFVRVMKERFLAGLDAEFFDYGPIDRDPALDDLEMRSRDSEDAWFDDDEGYDLPPVRPSSHHDVPMPPK
eukprot:m.25365 g.25365  ORF g.25365 m.25365 type:complete len:396 (+) comp7862_c0_seq1:34-1221(+)